MVVVYQVAVKKEEPGRLGTLSLTEKITSKLEGAVVIFTVHPLVAVKAIVPAEGAPLGRAALEAEALEIFGRDPVRNDIAVVGDPRPLVAVTEVVAELRLPKPLVVIAEAMSLGKLARDNRGAARQGPTHGRMTA